MKKAVVFVMGVLVLAVISSPALALSISIYDPANSGIGSMSWNLSGNTITIEETWTSSAPGYLIFDDMTEGVLYTVVKRVTNQSGDSWSSFATELLDPAGQQNDLDHDVLPYPAHVPDGWTTSNQYDWLIYYVASVPPTSTLFPSTYIDVDTDARDFIDFYGAVAADGSLFSITHGLYDDGTSYGSPNQAFLLSQRPNAFSKPTPDGGSTLILLGIGLAALASRLRRKE